MTNQNNITRRVLDDLKRDEEQRRDGDKPDPTADLDEFARRVFGNH